MNVTPNATGAPNFPNTLENLPAGFTPPAPSLTGVDPDFQVARTWQNNVQYEFAIGQQHYFTTGYTHVQGDLLPVIMNINPINPIGQLADGRPIFGAPSAATRLDPRFNQINVVQSIGDSTYNALALQFGRRLSGGVQFDFNYTIGKGEDNAPLHRARCRSRVTTASCDPTNLERDRGPNVMDTRHSFNGAIVAQPKFGSGAMGAIFNGLQFGAQLQFNSGLPQQRAQLAGSERRRHPRRSSAGRDAQLDLPAGALERRPAHLALRAPGRPVPRRSDRGVQERAEHAADLDAATASSRPTRRASCRTASCRRAPTT